MSDPEAIRGGQASMHDKLMNVVRQSVPLHDVVVESIAYGYTPGRFQLGDAVLQLLLEVAEFRDRAVSYRGFDVAAGAWCTNGKRYARALGYNVKVDGTDLINIHAEDLVVEKVKDAGLSEISVQAIVGPVQEDHASGQSTETLHPCGRCRSRLGASGLIGEHTLIVTALPDFKVIQIASLEAIVMLHDENVAGGIATFRFDKTPAILQPREWPVDRTQPMRVPEIDSSDYDNSVGSFLINRFVSLQNS